MTWKEQSVAIPVEDSSDVLEGVWQAGGERGAVIAAPHPEYGGSIESAVLNELAWGLYQSGVSSLRFNWRGVGASQGSISGDPAQADADYAAALEHVVATVDGPWIGSGYSFGAAAALRTALRDPRIHGLLLIAPPVEMIRSLPLADFKHPLWVIVGSDDAYAPVDGLSDLLAEAPKAQLEVILNADHFFVTRGLGDLARLIQSAEL